MKKGQTDRDTGKLADRQTVKGTGKGTGRQTNRQKDGWTETEGHKQTDLQSDKI